MRIMTQQKSTIKSWLPVFVTAVLFYFAGKLTLSLSLPPSYAAAIWPPAGIGLAAVLLWGNRVLPGIFLAELLIHLELYNLSTPLPPPLNLLIFFLSPISSVLRAWLGQILVKKYAGYPNALISTRLIILFFLLAGPVATFLPAILSIYSLILTGIIIKQDLVFSFLTWWIGDCTGILVFTPIFFIIFDRSHRIWRQRIFTLGLPLCVMFAITAIGYLFAQQYEVRRLGKIISKESHIIRNDLQIEFQHHITALSIYKELANSRELVSEADFRLFSLLAFNHHADISYVAWLDAIKNQTEHYFIAKHVATNKGNNPADFISIAELANKLDLNSRFVTVTGKNQLVVFMPVLETGEKSCQCLKGIVGEVFNINKFVETALDKENIEHMVIKISTDKLDGQQQSVFQSSNLQELFDPLALAKHDVITLGDQKWLLEIAPDKKFLSEYYSWSVWQLLAGGMFLTGFMSIGLLVLTAQNESVRSEVDKRTEELKEINNKLYANEQQFRKLVQTQSAIVWRADPATCRFMFVSDEAESLLGYPVEQWINDADFWLQHIHEEDRET
ncbi:MAG: MASE1 domain-containing protein, partial [Methylobacter sp.]